MKNDKYHYDLAKLAGLHCAFHFVIESRHGGILYKRNCESVKIKEQKMKKRIIDLTEAEKNAICDAQPNCIGCPHSFHLDCMRGCKLHLEVAYGQEWAEVPEEETK